MLLITSLLRTPAHENNTDPDRRINTLNMGSARDLPAWGIETRRDLQTSGDKFRITTSMVPFILMLH